MADTAYTMSNKDAEEFLQKGGEFTLRGGAMSLIYVERAERYLLTNASGNGADHAGPRYATMQDIMEQYSGGDLSAWVAETPTD